MELVVAMFVLLQAPGLLQGASSLPPRLKKASKGGSGSKNAVNIVLDSFTQVMHACQFPHPRYTGQLIITGLTVRDCSLKMATQRSEAGIRSIDLRTDSENKALS